MDCAKSIGHVCSLQPNILSSLVDASVQCVRAGGPSELIGVIGNLFVNGVYTGAELGYLTGVIQTVTRFVLESAEQDPHYTLTHKYISVRLCLPSHIGPLHSVL